jgi:small-conductance mechanosensitive channel
MENQYTDQGLFGLSYNENLKTQLRSAAYWAGFAAILSLIGGILGLINYFVEKFKPVKRVTIEGFDEPLIRAQTSDTNIVSVVISLVLSIVFFYLLNRFSKQAIDGINGNNEELISSGLGSLSSYFIIFGVIMIIVIVFALLMIAGLAIGGAGGAR